MGLRRTILSRGLKVLHHPKVRRALGHPRTMDLFVAAVRVRDQIAATLVDARRRVVHAAGLATQKEVRDLKKLIRELEQRLRELG